MLCLAGKTGSHGCTECAARIGKGLTHSVSKPVGCSQFWLCVALSERRSRTIALGWHEAQQLWNLKDMASGSVHPLPGLCVPLALCDAIHAGVTVGTSTWIICLQFSSLFHFTCPKGIYSQSFGTTAWRRHTYPFPGHCPLSLFHIDLLSKTTLDIVYW